MKSWQIGFLACLAIAVLVIFGIFIVVGLRLLASVPAMPALTPTSSPTPTFTATLTPCPSPTLSPTATFTPSPIPDLAYIECHDLVHQRFEELTDSVPPTNTLEGVEAFCQIERQVDLAIHELRIDLASCPSPAHPNLLMVRDYYSLMLDSYCSWADCLGDYCDDGNPFALELANDYLDDIVRYFQEAEIQLTVYLSYLSE